MIFQRVWLCDRAGVVVSRMDRRHHREMTQARRQSRFRTIAEHYDLGYALAIMLCVAVFVTAILFYFDLV